MILISNHALQYLQSAGNVVIRVNLAWYGDLESTKQELKRLIKEYPDNDIFLDYPMGRSKPPQPQVSLKFAIVLANFYTKIKYFAISNAEDAKIMSNIRAELREDITLVPKIESTVGVSKLYYITQGAQTDIIMYDSEDLFSNVRGDSKEYISYSNRLKQVCKDNNIKMLSLQGVVFSDENNV